MFCEAGAVQPSLGDISTTKTDHKKRARHAFACGWTPPARSFYDWVALGLLMVAAAATFLINLTANGYGNEFYAAAAQAGSKSWWAFLWGASDAGGAISVDKPPASIWVTALFVRAFGLSSLSILLPQALMGIASTYLIYATCRRYWGNACGILAGAFFAATPIAVLMFRFNNPDALLVLLQLGGAACVLRALECLDTKDGLRARARWFALAGALCGFGFLTKQLQVLLVLPGFAVAMFGCSNVSWKRRFVDAAVALGSMIVAGGWWVLLTVAVPSGGRPYIGGSETDSFIELTFSYNGFGRLTGNESGAVVPGGSVGAGAWGETGIFRLFGSDFAGQFAWLAPLALAGLIVCIAWARSMQHHAEKTLAVQGDKRTSGLLLRRAFLAVFGGWLVVTWLTFSFMAGIFHQYYTVALAPVVAIFAAICVMGLWVMHKKYAVRFLAPLILALNTFWAAYVVAQANWISWLPVAILVVGLLGSVLLAFAALRSEYAAVAGRPQQHGQILLFAGTAFAALALMTGPVIWSVYTIATGHTGSIVTAGPSGGGMGGAPGGGMSGLLGGAGESTNDELVALLIEDADDYTWAAATTGSQSAASYQLASGLPVIAIGGFNGTDPAPSLEQFKQWVSEGRIHYYIVSGDMGGAGGPGGMSGFGGMDSMDDVDAADDVGSMDNSLDVASQIQAWVEENFEAQTVGGVTVYALA